MSYKNNQQQEDNDKQQDNNKQQEFYILVNNNLAPFASHHSDHTVLDIFEMKASKCK
ncbi:14258_t:CDS:2 [Rhizophagus irregularis]|nr:14258_t:CDS:2 [Rhizophagus irregularis]